MIKSLIHSIFGCACSRTTFPLTLSRNSGAPRRAHRETYVVCLDCGKEFEYDWQEMRVGRPVQIPVSIAALQPQQRAAR
jgi:hypothetical protein